MRERERERERERAREIGYRESRVRPYTVDGDGRRPAYSWVREREREREIFINENQVGERVLQRGSDVHAALGNVSSMSVWHNTKI
jgi:hypothetical protein